jgi:hypothetical protein
MAAERRERPSETDKFAGTTDPRLLVRLLSTRSMVVLAVSSLSSGKDLFSIPRRVSVSEERQFQNARSFSQRPQVERSLSLKVRSYMESINHGF